jgi:hypothetical protein
MRSTPALSLARQWIRTLAGAAAPDAGSAVASPLIADLDAALVTSPGLRRLPAGPD